MVGLSRSWLHAAAGALLLGQGAGEQRPAGEPSPPTAAESSGFARTSTSAEAEGFIEACAAASPRIARLSLGTSAQGRDLPLVLVAEPPRRTLAEARTGGRLAVVVVANIHGGEVEGKEASQILLREFSQGGHAGLLAELVVAFVPNYNPDGNDAIDRRNRADQNGPVEGVGQRPNGQGLDLNRDFVKADAPETRGLLAAVAALDAALVLDLHATDGSFHGYELTYAGAMHPASDPALLRYTAETFLPALRAAMRERGFETFDYGDFADPERPERGWFTFDHRPRFSTNYFGLCNRLTLLSEAYSHEPFEVRVKATREFVLAALRFAAANAGALRELRAAAARRAAGLAAEGASLPARGEIAVTRERDPVLVGSCRREADPVTGLERLIDSGESRPVEMPIHVSFAGRDPVAVPLAWVVASPTQELEERLAAHGVRSERLAAARRARVRSFRVSRRVEETRPFQGRRLAKIEGADEERSVELAAGSLLVRSDQPLARLAFVLLEPASDDGFATWGLLGTGIATDASAGKAPSFPVERVVAWEP